ncbi:hypothetical protein [Methylorubrum aminovorans]
MALMTAQPWKPPKTGAHDLRQRTPLDLLHSVKGQSVALPVGDAFITVKVGDAIQASLLTLMFGALDKHPAARHGEGKVSR